MLAQSSTIWCDVHESSLDTRVIFLRLFVYVVHKQETRLSYTVSIGQSNPSNALRDFRPCRCHLAVDWSDWADGRWRKYVHCFLNMLEHSWTIFQHVKHVNMFQPCSTQSLSKSALCCRSCQDAWPGRNFLLPETCQDLAKSDKGS